MTNEEYLFKETERERKRNGRGAFNKVRQGGKTIRFPSDYLSKKERDAMSSEVRTYDFSRPLGWKQFQAMPTDLRQKYLDKLTDEYYGLSNALIGESMGVENKTFAPYLNRHKLKVHRKVHMRRESFFASEDGKRWKEWLGEQEDDEAGVQTEETHEEEPHAEEKTRVEEVKAKSVDINNIAMMLQMLQGMGAELTIKITL